MKNIFMKTSDEVLKLFGVTDKTVGLSEQQVALARKKYGSNSVTSLRQFSFIKTLMRQFFEPLILLLAVCSGIIFFVGDQFDAFIIIGIIVLNTILGALQERRIAHIVQELQQFEKKYSTVIRLGERKLVLDTLLVPGDILILQEGDHVPADARIIDCYDFTLDESILTGESDPVVKKSDPLDKEVPLFEQSSMLFNGSHVVSGYGTAVVVATGVHTESRRHQKQVEVFSDHMPLQKDLAHVLRFILWLIVFICISLFVIGFIAGKPLPELLAALLALFMCVVPQGLPVIMTVILVTGAYSMARHNIITKRLQAIEALGRAQVVIFDKTGTLTKNELMVTALTVGTCEYTVTGSGYDPEGKIVTESGQAVTKEHCDPVLREALEAVLLLDRSVIECGRSFKKCMIKGSTNEAALKVCAGKAGITLSEIQDRYSTLHVIPFGSAHQCSAGFYYHDGKGVIFLLGSPEVVQQRCSFLNPLQKKQIDTLVRVGARVLVLARKSFSLPEQSLEDPKKFFGDLVLSGFEMIAIFGIQDTLRPRASEIIHSMHNATIHVVMATGDNSKTAGFMAHKAGILRGDQEVMEGSELRSLTDQMLLDRIEKVTVFARVTPTDKARLVEFFKKQGKTVMVVGDGVNDVPALSTADISVVMGATGSELAKEVSHVVLLNDAFEKIPEGIEYGRHIFYTFKRVILYFFTTNFAEVLVMLFALAGGLPIPLLACQILWLNLVTDGFLDTALSLEPLEKDLMHFSWVKEQRRLLDRSLVMQVVVTAILASSCSVGVFVWYMPLGLSYARTMAMVVLTCCQWITAMTCRSLKLSLWKQSFFSNRWLAYALIGIAVTQVAIIYVPFLQLIFKTVALSIADWLVVGGIVLLLLAVDEIRKATKRKSL